MLIIINCVSSNGFSLEESFLVTTFFRHHMSLPLASGQWRHSIRRSNWCLWGTRSPKLSACRVQKHQSPVCCHQRAKLNKSVQHNSSNAPLPHTLLRRPPSPCLSLIKMTHALLDRQRPAQHSDGCSALMVLLVVWVSSGLWSSRCFPSRSLYKCLKHFSR